MSLRINARIFCMCSLLVPAIVQAQRINVTPTRCIVNLLTCAHNLEWSKWPILHTGVYRISQYVVDAQVLLRINYKRIYAAAYNAFIHLNKIQPLIYLFGCKQETI